jgi:hypothetical protein
MPTKTDLKKETIKFDPFKTLVVIQSEKILSTIFTEKHGDNYKQHFMCIQNNMMNEDAKELIKSIFKTIIINDNKMIAKYENVKVPTIIPTVEKVKRRLSLAEIKARADARGGEFTENERALIACNDLKNIYVRVHNKGKYNLFTDEDARIVIATIDTVKKKLFPILNKK